MSLEGGPAAEKRWRMVDMRNLIGAMWPGSGTLLDSDFSVTPAPVDAGHAVQISPGRAIAHGAAYRQGAYFAWSDADEVVPWPGPDAQPRIDTLLLQWFDPSMGTVTRSAGPGWLIVPGQPSASPVARSDAALASTWAEPGGWLRAADVRIDPGQTSIPAGNITRRFLALTSRAKQQRLLTSTNASSAFRNWLAQNPGTRKAFTEAYWPPVEVMVPYTGELRVTVTGRAYNTRSANTGLGICYHLSGANTSGISAYTSFEYLTRGGHNETASVTQHITGLNPGRTLVHPNVWVSESSTASSLNLNAGALLVDPVF